MTRVATVLACVAVLGYASTAEGQMSEPAAPVIVTQGEATLKRAPDRAWVTVAAETRHNRAAEARRQNAEAMTAVQTALEGAGVPSAAIRTTGFSLTPEFDWKDGRSILRGYVARNQVEVRVDDLASLAGVLDAANAPGNVALSLQGLRFDLKDETAARNEALQAAVQDALSRARAMAAGAGRSLGEIRRIEEHHMGPIMPMAMAMRTTEAMKADVATPVTPGEIDVRGQITLTIEIE